ncbi:MAG: hypothetical protein ACRERE_42365 [Candidatus Entotheonellia bacterium]
MTQTGTSEDRRLDEGVNRIIPPDVIYFEPSWNGPSGHDVRKALTRGDPYIYTQQGIQQGSYFDEIAVDPITLKPGDEEIIT